MVAAAAREIGDGQVVFTGMRLPLLAFALAKQTHAPGAIGLFECGLVRDTPTPEMVYTMSDPANVAGAIWATRMTCVMALLAQGTVDLGFIGGAEIDRYGNLNTTYVRGRVGEMIRLPGSGGAADIACLARRLVVIMPHEKRRLVERVNYVTSPGNGNGPGWRARVGLPRGKFGALITTRAVFRFGDEGLAELASYHPGESPDSVQLDTGWTCAVAGATETEPPTREELAIIRRQDPLGFWTGRRGRPA